MTATTSPGAASGGSAAAEQIPLEFRRVWLVAIVRGVLLLVLGLLLLIDPVRTDLSTMRWVLGAFMIADGLVAALAALWHRNQASWQVWLTQSAVDVILGLVVLAWPDLTPKALYYVLAAWVIALGVTLLVTSSVLARSRDIEWSWTLTAGVVAFLFGILLVLRTGQDESDLATTSLVFAFFAWVAGAIYVVTGFATRALALELRSLRAQLAERGVTAAPARLVLGGVGEGAPRPAPRPAKPPRTAPGPTKEPTEKRARPEKKADAPSSGAAPGGTTPAPPSAPPATEGGSDRTERIRPATPTDPPTRVLPTDDDPDREDGGAPSSGPERPA
ncbi:HdeD family acid-resistance protein [Luteimicrobium sp. NPDC057192]|uniref:HdeD family acid-resistance protein n=1 Tax=Luteimicrobium sp. NPDC057192 TaxID=3346042 RepID=UPI003637DC12